MKDEAPQKAEKKEAAPKKRKHEQIAQEDEDPQVEEP